MIRLGFLTGSWKGFNKGFKGLYDRGWLEGK